MSAMNSNVMPAPGPQATASVTPDTIDALYRSVRWRMLLQAGCITALGLVTVFVTAVTVFGAIAAAIFTWVFVRITLRYRMPRKFFNRLLASFAAGDGLAYTEYSHDRRLLGWTEATALFDGNCVTRLFERGGAGTSRFAFYELRFERSRRREFAAPAAALIFAGRRKTPGKGITVLLPGAPQANASRLKKFPNLQPIEIHNGVVPSDFDILSNDPGESQRLLDDKELVDQLVRLRRISPRGAVSAYFGPEVSLMAAGGSFVPPPTFSALGNKDAAIRQSCDLGRRMLDLAKNVEAVLP
jgi:hypothetical protein